MNALKIFNKALNWKYAIGAFNAGNLEIVKAIVQAAQARQSAVIIEASAGEIQYFGMKNFLAVVENFRAETTIPILTNLDHGSGIEECQQAIEAGFDMIHFDGSELPYEENVKITKVLVEQAHHREILVEGEINKIVGSSSLHSMENAESVAATGNYTDPNQVADFVRQTGVDILASFVGNVHGVYQTAKKLDLERLRIIAQQVPCFLSLHGGSGLAEEDIKGTIKCGVVKINVNTELRVAFRDTLENVLKGSDEVAIYKIMPPAIAAVQKVVEEKIELFNGGKPPELEIPNLAAGMQKEEVNEEV